LRVETVAKRDKKKSELYFKKSVKKILTENSPEKAYQIDKTAPGGIVDAACRVTHHLPLGPTKIPFGAANEMNFRTSLIRFWKG
jgi:hypothetical protein